MPRLARVLSIDGGGMYGIIPGQVLVALEAGLQRLSARPDLRLADCFDLIAGTSTGGILACIYLCPDGAGGGRPRFSASDAVDIYLSRGARIFHASPWQRLRSLGGLVKAKYLPRELEKAFVDHVGDLRLGELLKPCLMTSYDIERRRIVYLTRDDARSDPALDFLVRDALRATSAAPGLFGLAVVRSATGVRYALVDGSVFANNPALSAYAEARRCLPGRPAARDMLLLSVGTGFTGRPYDHRAARDWGALRWSGPIMKIMMSASSEAVHRELEQIFESAGSREHYLRVNSPMKLVSSAMDDASPQSIRHLRMEGDRVAREFDRELERFAGLLLQWPADG